MKAISKTSLDDWLRLLDTEEKQLTELAKEVNECGAYLRMLTKRRDVLKEFVERLKNDNLD